VLDWRLSNTLDADFCVVALKEALAAYGPPEIFNMDQGSQFTCSDWINKLKKTKMQISMDSNGHWIDNRMIERLWRLLKYECVYLRAF
jgi:putative transposase